MKKQKRITKLKKLTSENPKPKMKQVGYILKISNENLAFIKNILLADLYKDSQTAAINRIPGRAEQLKNMIVTNLDNRYLKKWLKIDRAK